MQKIMKNKGITLVALVVTIIILLILAGVTLNIALSENGIFEKTKEAVEKYKKAEEDEENAIDKIADILENITIDYNDYVGCYVEGYKPEIKTDKNPCIIEQTTSGYKNNGESQKFTTETEMKWRIWDYDENKGIIRLISEKPTNALLTLQGVAGYNNGVWAMNEICKECYSNNEDGVTVTNLKRSDIQKVSNYDYTKYKHKDEGTEAEEVIDDSSETYEDFVYFGESKTYGDNNKYPEIWMNNDSNWQYEYNEETGTKREKDKECTIWEKIENDEGKMSNNFISGTSSTEFKQSFYVHNYKKEEFKNEKYYNLIFECFDENTKNYWLASRVVVLYHDDCAFGFGNIGDDNISCRLGADGVFRSMGTTRINSDALRPIVSIDLKKSGCTITKEDKDDNVTFKLSWDK